MGIFSPWNAIPDKIKLKLIHPVLKGKLKTSSAEKLGVRYIELNTIKNIGVPFQIQKRLQGTFFVYLLRLCSIRLLES